MPGMNFHSKFVYEEKYIKTKVKIINSAVNTVFWNEEVPKEGIYYTCITVTWIDSVTKMEKKICSSVFRRMSI